MSKYALTVGINKYGSGSDLAGCVNDAHDWATALKTRGFEVAELIDKQATGANMVAAIQQLIALEIQHTSTGIQMKKIVMATVYGKRMSR